jgi:cell division protein ZapB
MEAELNTLDEKIHHLVQICQRLRADNNELRQQLAGAQNQNKLLTEKIESARQRLENLLTKIPEDGE